MSALQWRFDFDRYELLGCGVTASIRLVRPLVFGRLVDEWKLTMVFFCEHARNFDTITEWYDTLEKAQQAAEARIVTFKLEGKI